VQVGGRNAYRGIYFIDQLLPAAGWTFTLSGRYNAARVELRDRSGTRAALDAEHSFSRFNPGIGVNWNPAEQVTGFASLTQGMRVPAPVELSCADPAAPCVLPNQFLADPPLKPVIARTAEAGARLRPARAMPRSSFQLLHRGRYRLVDH